MTECCFSISICSIFWWANGGQLCTEYVKNTLIKSKFLKYWTAQMMVTLLKDVAADRAFLFVNKSIEQIDITSQKWRLQFLLVNTAAILRLPSM